MKIAITYDWLNQFGGGERVLLELHALFPDAPIYTTVYDPTHLPAKMRGMDVRTSFLQRFPPARRRHQPFLPLMPMAFESFDLSEYDLVLTTNSACAKGVITAPGTINFCYCFTPCRYVWDLYHEYTQHMRMKAVAAMFAHRLRVWDRISADRVDHFVAISHEVAGRIKRHYSRPAEVIYPPVDVKRFQVAEDEGDDFYLVVSRLVPYKRIDLAVQAATRTGRRLVVVGDGSERRRLEAMAGPTVSFLGRRTDAEITELYSRCRAFLFPGFEDFGIAPVEAQAAGRPVIAYRRGGAVETVIDNETGVLFDEQDERSLIAAMEAVEARSFDPRVCRTNAERFDRVEFGRRLCNAIDHQVQLAGKGRMRVAPMEYRESA